MEPGMAFEPFLNMLMLVRPVIVDDKMQVHIRRRLDVDKLQKTNELLMSVSRHAIADDSAIEHVQCGK